MSAKRGPFRPWAWPAAIVLLGSLALAIACRWGNKDVPVVDAQTPTLTPEIPEVLGPIPADRINHLVRASSGSILTDLYRDVTKTCGIEQTFHNGQEAEHYGILESLGGGGGLIDFDGDGLLDVVVTGGGYYDGPGKKQIKGYGVKFFKNLGNWKFKDITAAVGLDQPRFFTHGVAVADYDRDGWPDLLVTGWGRMALYHNVPDGKGGRRFEEVSKQAGLPEGLWTTSAAWADFDGDGYPDLYVCQYVNWDVEKNNPVCPGYTSKFDRDVCPPKQFTGLPHHVFRNNGNGTFTDVSKEAGLRPHTGDPLKDNENGKGLGVVAVDINGDGKPDVYVANDTVDNFLYLNKSTPGNIRFEEVGLPSGVARDDRGVSNGSMGTDAAACDGQGRAWLWCTNYENEMHALYKNQGKALFAFFTQPSGIAAIGQQYVGFGTAFFDIDNHGWEDLVVSNGHVIRFPTAAGLLQRPVLMRNIGNARYVDITRQGGSYFRGEHMGRGLILGDLDNDGLLDLIISHVNAPVAVLRNEAQLGNHWLGLELTGKDHRDVVGARVTVDLGSRQLHRFAKGGASYLSSGDRRHLFGLGSVAGVKQVTVFWPPTREHPQGHEQHWQGQEFQVDRYWRLSEDKNAPETPKWASRVEVRKP
jgi:hypothetical protein